jgi:hypothetical protein
MHHLKTSHIDKLLKQALQETIESDPNSPKDVELGQVTVDWPTVTVLKAEKVKQPDIELLHSRVDRFDELKKEIEAIKDNKPVMRLPRKSLQVCINARPED